MKKAAREGPAMLALVRRFVAAHRESLAALAVLAGLCVAFAAPVLRHLELLGIEDWDQHLFYHEVARKSVAEYHQLPLWNPWFCGGTVMLANPQSRIVTPFFLLHLAFGALVGIKLEIVLHLILGASGTYLLATQLGLRRQSALIPACAYVLSSMFALNLTAGMTWFLSVAYLPWITLCAWVGFTRLASIAGGALGLAMMFCEGGAYPFAITLLFLGVLSSLRAAAARSPRELLGAVAAGGLALLLGAVKFVPTIEFMIAHPRPVEDYSGFSIASLAYSLLGRDQSIDAIYHQDRSMGLLSGMTRGMDENGMYVGLIVAALGLWGLVRAPKRLWPLTACLVLFLVLILGSRLEPSLYDALRKLPLYSNMRVAQRFRIVFLLLLVLYAGLGLTYLRDLVAAKLRRPALVELVVTAVLVAAIVDLFAVNRSIWADAFTVPPREVSRGAFKQVEKYEKSYVVDGQVNARHRPYSNHMVGLADNIALIKCYETANVPRAAIGADSPDYRGEVFVTDTEGEAAFEEWTPNELRVHVRTAGVGHLVVNQNYYPGWQADDGSKVGRKNGLIAVPVPAGDRTLVLRYRPWSFVIGAIVSLFTMAGVTVGLTLGRRRLRSDGSDPSRLTGGDGAQPAS